jgi:Ni/Fe-hydrogenase subunit HybB-like protein
MLMLYEVYQLQYRCQNCKPKRFSQVVTLTTLTEYFVVFSVQVNTAIIPRIDHDRFFSHYFQFIILLSSYLSKFFWHGRLITHEKEIPEYSACSIPDFDHQRVALWVLL